MGGGGKLEHLTLAGGDIGVPAVALSPAAGVAWLERSRSASCDASVHFWADLAAFVVDLLKHRRFYPDLEASDGGLRARWRPWVTHEPILKWLDAMAAAMPPSGLTADNQLDGPHAIESFLLTTTDALVRQAAAADEFFAEVRQRNERPEAPAEARWVAGLLSADGIITGTPDELALLSDRVRQWVGKLERRAAGPLRLEFVLDEPEEDPSQWPVRFVLYLMDESDAMIEAEQLWSEHPPELLGRHVLDRRKWLVEQLQSAAQTFTPLVRVLSEAAPAQVMLSTIEAHQLMREWADLLRQQGFGVALPKWMTRREIGLRMRVSPLDDSPLGAMEQRRATARQTSDFETGVSRMGLSTLIDFDWQVAIGDLRLSVEQFKAMLDAHQPLVRHEGQWIELDEQAAQAAIKYLDGQTRGKTTLGEAIRATFAAHGQSGLPILGLSGSGWLEHLLDQTPTTQFEAMTQPQSFAGTLRPYQLRGLDWLAFLDRLGIGACLADDMGLGKTIQLIALLLRERERQEPLGDATCADGAPASPDLQTSKPTLLFAPTSVVGNWVRELQRFAPSLKVLQHHGAQRLRGRALVHAAGRHDVVVSSYALAHRDQEDLAAVKWHRLVLDEAQKIKNPNAASTTAIASLAAPHRVALTGTPIENHLSELWSIMEVLNPGLLGSAGEFRRRFAAPIERGQDHDRAQRLRRLIQPFILRRTKSDPLVAAELPEKIEMRVLCNLTQEQATAYQRITDDMLGQIESASGIRRRGLILAALTRLKQVCDHPALVARNKLGPLEGRSGKCERLVEMLEEVLEEGDAALIFTQYRQMGHLLEKTLAERLGMPLQFLHGGTPAAQRDAMVEAFNAPGSKIRIFLLSLRAGGVGLNLTAANHVFHFDRWWNPAIEQQATDRAHRIGQTRTVQVHKFVCVGTVEERIDRMLQEKLALAEKIVGAGDDWLTNLSTEQLRDCLTLSQEAVGDF